MPTAALMPQQWNELQFVSWSEFQRMAPSIIQLEITRLGTMIESFRQDTGVHNGLVEARFALMQFVSCLREIGQAQAEPACAPHLRTALLALSFLQEDRDPRTAETLAYTLDRIRYVYDRISMIY